MRIRDAVIRAIEEGSDDCWYVFLRAGVAHHWHVTVRCAVDGFDTRIFNQLARKEPSGRGGMTFVERADGTLRPWLILGDDRRVGEATVFGGRRITDPPERRLGERLGAEHRAEKVSA